MTDCSPQYVGETLRQVADEIPQSFIQSLYDKLPMIMEETIKARGGYGPIARNLQLPKKEQQ